MLASMPSLKKITNVAAKVALLSPERSTLPPGTRLQVHWNIRQACLTSIFRPA
jgi:hypothetical protein